ncbi:unnamed protein product [Adineta ricciae]|uniref:G-protein coupled receptors family 1 profile domain-containing protein n=1 Tax=Adineta ricciae TaxID=249248 RepID=A0A815KKQ5_ADIRI|nr:unnamed protein product [Adineta ricciae]CAF1410912.1 unnamed protein product [Adineta ricciae]
MGDISHETSTTRAIKFWILLFCQIPSVLCSIFVLYHMVRSRANRQVLANHVVIAMLGVGVLIVTIDLSIALKFLYQGTVNPRSDAFCYTWVYINYILYVNGIYLMAWASIERHFLVFSPQYFRTFRQQLIRHYFPILLCLVYPIVFYIYTISFYPCAQVFNYQRLVCGSPCFKKASFILNFYDQAMHSLIPCIIIVLFTVALVVRVIRHKRRIQGLLFSWKRQQRMVLQLLSIACLYIIFNAPPFFVAGIRATVSKTFATVEYEIYFLYLFYVLTLFLPFVCLPSLGGVRAKLNALVNTIFRQL